MQPDTIDQKILSQTWLLNMNVSSFELCSKVGDGPSDQAAALSCMIPSLNTPPRKTSGNLFGAGSLRQLPFADIMRR